MLLPRVLRKIERMVGKTLTSPEARAAFKVASLDLTVSSGVWLPATFFTSCAGVVMSPLTLVSADLKPWPSVRSSVLAAFCARTISPIFSVVWP